MRHCSKRNKRKVWRDTYGKRRHISRATFFFDGFEIGHLCEQLQVGNIEYSGTLSMTVK